MCASLLGRTPRRLGRSRAAARSSGMFVVGVVSRNSASGRLPELAAARFRQLEERGEAVERRRRRGARQRRAVAIRRPANSSRQPILRQRRGWRGARARRGPAVPAPRARPHALDERGGERRRLAETRAVGHERRQAARDADENTGFSKSTISSDAASRGTGRRARSAARARGRLRTPARGRRRRSACRPRRCAARRSRRRRTGQGTGDRRSAGTSRAGDLRLELQRAEQRVDVDEERQRQLHVVAGGDAPATTSATRSG